MKAESVKAHLKNLADGTGKTFQEELLYYGLERMVYRLSVSKYADQFVLKGGIFLYSLFNGENQEVFKKDVGLQVRKCGR